ncbi:C40 family peptidase [Prochlorococcus sp. MIT 1307]|uniref:C40 family peptidase n=1 Tax=Prochlorococcus sp. MIT 1307 TaxID=3096219 RepID=UPI002A74DBD6|nr:C40 family peptidase [Prochlorococcus sp. MIT 1307]
MTIHGMLLGSCWQLCVDVNGFAGPNSDELVTQASAGRRFQLIHDDAKNVIGMNNFPRVEIRLLEDDYQCWVELKDVVGHALSIESWRPRLFNSGQIQRRIPSILNWLTNSATLENKYLWGGTLGPDFDCSGLVQAAFSREEIWLPRDAYQQERFCQPLKISSISFKILLPGDLLFFGTPEQCNHVGIYIGEGKFCHSSGVINGRNGIGFDGLQSIDNNPVASYYRSHLRGAGRVMNCYEGMTYP